MSEADYRYLYGPVFSRRLGSSLGVDLVPFKTCSYDCIYCQLGRTTAKTTERKEYVPIQAVLAELERRLDEIPCPDYISLAGSGEPTLCSELGKLIREIKRLTRVPVAMLTNGSLLWREDVREELMEADLVLPSLDAGDEKMFRLVNRPHGQIRFEKMVEGIIEFTRCFPKSIWLEVLLLDGITSSDSEVRKIADLAARIRPERVQLNTVSRPGCDARARPLSSVRLEEFARLFSVNTEVISARENGGSQPAKIHDVADSEIIALLSRRPCSVLDVARGLDLHANDATKRLSDMVREGTLGIQRRNNIVYFEVIRTDHA